MRYKVCHVRFGQSVELGGNQVHSWDETRKKYPEDECIYDTEKQCYMIRCKGVVWHVHCTNVSQAQWLGKIDPMAKARAAKASKQAA